MFTDRVRRVFAMANQEAQRFNHPNVRSEHVLLGLLREGAGTGSNVLKNIGLDLPRVRMELESQMLADPDDGRANMTPLTPSAKSVIEHSISEARRLGHHYVGTEHLLLGLIADTEGLASRVLVSLGARLETARACVAAVLRSD